MTGKPSCPVRREAARNRTRPHGEHLAARPTQPHGSTSSNACASATRYAPTSTLACSNSPAASSACDAYGPHSETISKRPKSSGTCGIVSTEPDGLCGYAKISDTPAARGWPAIQHGDLVASRHGRPAGDLLQPLGGGPPDDRRMSEETAGLPGWWHDAVHTGGSSPPHMGHRPVRRTVVTPGYGARPATAADL